MNNVHFNRASDEWETPQDLFGQLSAEFGPFDLDVAASSENHKVATYFTKEDDGLKGAWDPRNWCNPPYSQLKKWIEKAAEERRQGNLTVMLIPARTDTVAFHDHIWNKAGVEIRFLRRRLRFGGSKTDAPFPSMVVIFSPQPL